MFIRLIGRALVSGMHGVFCDLVPYRKLAKAGEFALEQGRLAIAGDLAASIGVALLKSGCEVDVGIAGHCLWHAHL